MIIDQLVLLLLENINERDQIYLNVKSDSIFVENSIFSKVVPIWNTLPKNLKTEQHTYVTIKAKMKIFF